MNNLTHSGVLLNQLPLALALDIQALLNDATSVMLKNLLAPLGAGEIPAKAVLEFSFHCEYNDSGYDMILQESSEIDVLLTSGERLGWRLDLNGADEQYTYRDGTTETLGHSWIYSLVDAIPVQQVSQALEMWAMLFLLTWNENGKITVTYGGDYDYSNRVTESFLGEQSPKTRTTAHEDEDDE